MQTEATEFILDSNVQHLQFCLADVRVFIATRRSHHAARI